MPCNVNQSLKKMMLMSYLSMDPDMNQNVTGSSLGHAPPIPQFQSELLHKVLSLGEAGRTHIPGF